MPKRAKKAWRKNIDLEDLYQGLERTKQELARGYPFFPISKANRYSGIVREKEDGELYSIDEVGGVVEETVDTTAVEPPKKKRRALRVD